MSYNSSCWTSSMIEKYCGQHMASQSIPRKAHPRICLKRAVRVVPHYFPLFPRIVPQLAQVAGIVGGPSYEPKTSAGAILFSPHQKETLPTET